MRQSQRIRGLGSFRRILLTEQWLVLVDAQGVAASLPHRCDGVRLYRVADQDRMQARDCLDGGYLLPEDLYGLAE